MFIRLELTGPPVQSRSVPPHQFHDVRETGLVSWRKPVQKNARPKSTARQQSYSSSTPTNLYTFPTPNPAALTAPRPALPSLAPALDLPVNKPLPVKSDRNPAENSPLLYALCGREASCEDCVHGNGTQLYAALSSTTARCRTLKLTLASGRRGVPHFVKTR